MASDETMTFQDEEYMDDDMDDDHHRQWHPHHPHNVSRLSVCTSSTLCGVDDDDDDVDNALSMYVSHLSIESYEEEEEGDADAEFSDGKDLPNSAAFSSDSDSELGGACYSLPATPPRRRNRVGSAKEYASENEAGAKKGVLNMEEKTKRRDPWSWRRRRRRIQRDRYLNTSSGKKEKEDGVVSGESDGVRVITRAKGGRRSLCMDLEEMKACRDLGFELEKEKTMLEMPSHLSLSNSTLDTSSGGNSPIANWRISSPGDDPRDVKARLKVWAQAVAMASASKYGA
ncbi:uncharacterized protein G2W53_044099 [Senna tora]|uniref:Fold protein n=1 Tax=Senna tora TaxID=362788 RepID=A0A834SLS4_9FABA|nr:uncharacterized protein G2W53_044099 [Senna tora]